MTCEICQRHCTRIVRILRKTRVLHSICEEAMPVRSDRCRDQIRIHVSPQEKERIERAASVAGTTVTDWVRRKLNAALAEG